MFHYIEIKLSSKVIFSQQQHFLKCFIPLLPQQLVFALISLLYNLFIDRYT